ncbi:MAG: toprim domain-containing protein [Gaiellaceae bacterium MAG52_C11]|nr:toprim domain-containing protein [Candidatus Gaiellasilicea maunaloa]
MSSPSQQRIGDFYADVVLPTLADRLDTAFPEFGWKRDARGWVATNEEMTHRLLGVRAERVVAHGPAPRGFLVHGADATLWTAYLNGGIVPRGEAFAPIVREIAARAGVDTSPIDRPQPRNRRVDLLQDFFTLCRMELHGDDGADARAYLERRGLPAAAIDRSGLGVVPHELFTRKALEAAGYTELEVARSGVLADGRWPGRLCGAWRVEEGKIRTLWARSLKESDTSTRYLYLSGANRSGLPPYGLYEALKQPLPERRELVLVEGLLDVHHLRAKGFSNIAAAGSARLQPAAITRLHKLGFDSVVLAFDNDAPGREGTARAIEAVSRAKEAPALRVLEPTLLADAKDPDAFVRQHGIDKFRGLLDRAGCAISWRALELTRGATPDDEAPVRRAALSLAGNWLGTLPARLSLEQEDAVRHVAEQCGYSRAAVERAFHARFWDQPERARRGRTRGPVIER